MALQNNSEASADRGGEVKQHGSVARAQAQYLEDREVRATLEDVRAKEGLRGGWTPRRELRSNRKVSRGQRPEGDCEVPAADE